MKLSIEKLNISGSVKNRLMFVSGAVLHLCFLFIFLTMEIMPLVYVNIGSVLLYIIGALFGVNKFGHMRYGWIIGFYLEIILHAVVATLLLGNNVSFHLYALIVIPMGIYVLFFSCSVEKFLFTLLAFVVGAVVMVAASFVALDKLEMFPYFPLSYDETQVLRMFNLAVVAAMLVVFSLLFAIEIYALVQRLNETNRRLEYTATHDELTGLYNRRSLRPMFDLLETIGEPYCVALGDIDDFKKVNDVHGHDAGDLVLKTVSAIISDGICWDDIACRWGGEEILIILRGEYSDCLARLEEIHRRIQSERVCHVDRQIGVTMTFGFLDSAAEDNTDAMISAVDKLLYYGKKNGKNQIVK